MCSMHYARWDKTGEPGPVESYRGGKCTEKGCGKPHRSKGLCALHYDRKRRTGRTDLANPPAEKPWHHIPRNADPLVRFMARVVVTEWGCWEWQDSLNKGGYGQFQMNGKRLLAHRASYLLHVGPIPDGLDLDHLCHTRDPDCPGGDGCPHRRCVAPDHLEPVTRSVNLQRGNTGLWRTYITHCPKNHPYDEVNTYYSRRGGRGCRQCRSEASRKYHERKRAQRA